MNKLFQLIILFISVFINSENLIVVITDGMTFDAMSILRKVSSDPARKIQFDRFTNLFYCETTADNTYITDSAAAATAIFCGVKTNNGVLGQDSESQFEIKDGKAVETILEYARKNGKLTGIISNARITHATPAGTYAHINSRNYEYDIASQLTDKNIDIILGGGMKYFLKENRKDKRDLISIFKKKGYSQIVFDDISNMNIPDTKIIGLFNNSHLNYEFSKDDSKEPRLSALAEYSLICLDKISKSEDKDFFLMIESGRIDHAAHYHATDEYMFELFELEKVVKLLIDYAETTNTSIILTSDHATANPVFIGTIDSTGLHTMDSYFIKNNFSYSDKESYSKLMKTVKIEWIDASKYGASGEDDDYKGDHSASDVLGFEYSKLNSISDVFVKNTDLIKYMKEILAR